MSDEPLMLNELEKKQYSRHLLLPHFGETEQLALKNAHVLIVGVGGLGNPVAHYLAAAGMGTLTLVDFDRIELHNIHRQLLFGVNDCGKSKAEVAAQKLQSLYPSLNIHFSVLPLDETTGEALTDSVGLIADCTDTYKARYTIDSIGRMRGIPVMYGAVHRWEGQISLFHGKAKTSYAELYPLPPTSTLAGTCEQEGIVGPMAGIIGSMMATSIIEYIALGSTHCDGRLIRFNGLRHETFCVELQRMENQSGRTLIAELTFREFNDRTSNEPECIVIDVREHFEHEEHNLGGICRPAGEVNTWKEELQPNASIVLYCAHGVRSLAIARFLEQKRPDLQIAHLKNGIYSETINHSDISNGRL
jgi:adenylyltransferase/sulfurtransferase